jgi:hypothetical protein
MNGIALMSLPNLALSHLESDVVSLKLVDEETGKLLLSVSGFFQARYTPLSRISSPKELEKKFVNWFSMFLITK